MSLLILTQHLGEDRLPGSVERSEILGLHRIEQSREFRPELDSDLIHRGTQRVLGHGPDSTSPGEELARDIPDRLAGRRTAGLGRRRRTVVSRSHTQNSASIAFWASLTSCSELRFFKVGLLHDVVMVWDEHWYNSLPTGAPRIAARPALAHQRGDLGQVDTARHHRPASPA